MHSEPTRSVIVVGAGIAGLTAARRLKEAELEVRVIDKGRGVGGRMATRRVGDAVLDHGAQYFTARDPRFVRMVEDWCSAGAAREWSMGYGSRPDSISYRGSVGMTAIPKLLAQRLEVRSSERVESVTHRKGRFAVDSDVLTGQEADAVILTAPVPQTLDMLDAGGLGPTGDARVALKALKYAQCFALLVELEGPSRVPTPGGIRLDEGPIAWIADNRQKGVSPEAWSLTIHASEEFSRTNLDEHRDDVGARLLAAAAPWLGSEVRSHQVHRWLFSRPVITHPEPAHVIDLPGPLVLAGDAFGGPRVEGAALSGLAAAEEILKTLAVTRSTRRHQSGSVRPGELLDVSER